MNYYERHLGDYARDTGHLSQAEHGAYNLLLDRYYATEQPIPAQIVYGVGRARTAAERKAVDSVLAQYFTLSGDGYEHKRVHEEIERFRVKSDKARKSAEQRWHSEGNANASETHGVGNALQSPVTSNQEKKPTAAAPPRAEYPQDFETAWTAYPKREGDNPKWGAFGCWKARVLERHGAAEILAGVRRYARWCELTGKIGTETVMQAKRFFGKDKPFLNTWTTGADKPARPPSCVMCAKDSTRRLEGFPYCDDHKPVERAGLPQIAALAAKMTTKPENA